MEGLRVASKGLEPLPRRRESALAHGCGEGGRLVMPLARAAAVSTGLRVRAPRLESEARRADQYLRAGTAAAKLRHGRCPAVSSLRCVLATTLLRKHQRQHGADQVDVAHAVELEVRRHLFVGQLADGPAREAGG